MSLTKIEVSEIKQYMSLGVSDSELSKTYGVSHKTISDIRGGNTWGNVMRNDGSEGLRK